MTDRTPTDFALEHAEYMAKDAERLLEALSEYAAAHMALEEGDYDSEDDITSLNDRCEKADEAFAEHTAHMRSGIYEFRKRRDRALATPAPAQPERQAADVDEMAAWMRRLVRALRKAAPGNALAEKALDDLKRRGLLGDALRQAEEPDPLHVANERGEGWQPIETAPERGIILLGLAPNEEHEDGYVSPGYWMESDEDGPDNMGHDAGFVDVHFDFFSCARSFGNPTYQHKGLQPTHWMPLPPPPAAPKDPT